MLPGLLPELLDHILHYLGPMDVMKLSSTNHEYRCLLKEKLFHTVAVPRSFLHPEGAENQDTKVKKITESMSGALEFTKVMRFPPNYCAPVDLLKVISRNHGLEELCLSYHSFHSNHNAVQLMCKGLKQLKVLNVSHTNLKDSDCVVISNLEVLQELVLFHCWKMTDQGMVHIGRIKTLRLLDVGSTLLTQATFYHIGGLVLLEELVLFNWYSEPHSESTQNLRKLSQLKKLDLSSCHHISDSCWSVFSVLPLQELKLFRCHGFNEVGVSHIANIKTLEKLDLCSCEGISDRDVGLLADLPLLKELRLEGCRFLTNACIPHILLMKNLRKLNIKLCVNIADKHLLTHLDIKV